jgi:hypothetical protein
MSRTCIGSVGGRSDSLDGCIVHGGKLRLLCATDLEQRELLVSVSDKVQKSDSMTGMLDATT